MYRVHDQILINTGEVKIFGMILVRVTYSPAERLDELSIVYLVLRKPVEALSVGIVGNTRIPRSYFIRELYDPRQLHLALAHQTSVRRERRNTVDQGSRVNPKVTYQKIRRLYLL